MNVLLLLVIAAATACIPLFVPIVQNLFPNLKMKPAASWLPILAGVLFIVSFRVPNIHISTETSTFQQHFIGGGIYCALLYTYFKQLLGWQAHWIIDFVLLFAWTSAFGVANKLGEFALLKTHLAYIDTADTDWDLLANTLGAIFAYIILKAANIARMRPTK